MSVLMISRFNLRFSSTLFTFGLLRLGRGTRLRRICWNWRWRAFWSFAGNPVGYARCRFSFFAELMAELYLNYDCDVHSTNLFQDLVKHLSRQAAPACVRVASVSATTDEGAWSAVDQSILYVPRVTSSHNILAFEGLLAILENFLRPDCALDGDDDDVSTEFLMTKKTKNRLETAAKIFNQSPADMIAALQQLGVLPPNKVDFQSVAHFLRVAPGLDMTAVGDYLAKGNDFNTGVREAFVQSFDFGGMPVTTALREYLNSFKLPGESQLIERLMESFSQCYFTSQKIFDENLEVTLPPSKKPRTPEEEKRLRPLYTVRVIPTLNEKRKALPSWYALIFSSGGSRRRPFLQQRLRLRLGLLHHHFADRLTQFSGSDEDVNGAIREATCRH